MDNRMTFRTEGFDIAPAEAKEMYAALQGIAQHWDGMDPAKIPSKHIAHAADLVRAFQTRIQWVPRYLPDEFILVHAPKPARADFDDWMQRNRATKGFGDVGYKFFYADYGAHPIRHLQNWVSLLDSGRGAYAYFVPHRKATQLYEYRKGEGDLPPFCMHYNFAYPVFQTIDLRALEIARGPYAGQSVVELFDDGPGLFLVKKIYYSKSVQKLSHRRTIVYATWVAHLAPPYGTWRNRVR